MLKRQIFCVFIIVFSIISVYSQQSKTYFQDLVVGGVPFNKKVNVLYEDSIGYLWIGSNSGLYRYDGNHLIHYQNDVFESFSIPNNSINTILEDKNQNLWIGSESYLIHFNRKENKFKGFFKNITSTVLYKTQEGSVWVNIGNDGLVKIEPQQELNDIELPLVFNDGISYDLKYNKDINSFVEDNFHRYWMGTAEGIFCLDKSNNKIQKKFNQGVTSLKVFKNNQILVTTVNDFYILRYNKTDKELEVIEHYKDIVKSLDDEGRLKTLTINSLNDNVWIGTTNGLIKGMRDNNAYHFSFYSQQFNGSNLLNNHISSTIFDSYGNLWVGSLKGVNKHLHRSTLFNYNNVSTPNKTENTRTNCVFYVNKTTMLVGMEDGLFAYDIKRNSYTKIIKEINNVNKIVFNYEKKKLLIAAGVNLYESNEFDGVVGDLKLTKIKSYEKNIMDVMPINKNEVFVGIWGGIDIVNNSNTLSKFKKNLIDNFKHNHISVILLTNENKLWIGTRGEGLSMVDFNDENYKTYLPTKENGLTSNAILSLYEDVQGKIWIGTRGGGLNVYNRETNTFQNFKKHKGQTPKTISAIEGDISGNIWLSTDDGVTRFNEASRKFIPFGIEDGIREGQFVFNSSAVNDNKVEVYFGCKDGFYTIYTDKYLQKDVLPTTVITDFYTLGATKNEESETGVNLVNKKDTSSEKPLELSYEQNNIVVNFSSLDLTTPSKNEYAYKLEGLNDYWIHTTASNRNANYNDLSPGTYTFMVKSSNSDGVWNETPTKFTFSIKPPFWKSTVAIILYVLCSLLGIFFAYLLIKKWYGLKQNLVAETVSREKDNEHNRMKMVFFTDISHELRTPLALILGSLEKVVKEKNFTLSPITVQRIYNNTLRMHRLINQVMDIRKFDEGKLKLSISKNEIVKDVMIIKNAFNDFAKIYNIKYDFNSKEDEISGWYDVDILEKILFNLLSNAFKYTQQNGEINVSLDVYEVTTSIAKELNLKKGNYIKCTVYDNGIGIPEEDLESIFNRYYQSTQPQSAQVPGTGIGMELVQKLIERHHGCITVKSKENVFTEFTFHLPIDQKRYTKEECIEKGAPLKKNFIKNSEYQVIEEVAKEHDEKVNTKKTVKPTVLIVEDNSDLRGMIKEELKKDFCVLEASNGKEGYEAVLKDKPQLIISDILMPIEDGISMLKKIKANNEINRIPIFMLTAKNSEETKIECLSLGADDFIEKPFSLEFVMWKVKNTLMSRMELKQKYSKVITAEPSDIKVDSNDEKFIKKLVKIIEDSMSDNTLSVEYLASEVGMSRANLYRKVQHILSDTPVNFIKTIRLKRAAQLLKKDSMYISEVAYMTGFNNQRYFSKCFHKEYGMSPTEYIKQNVNKEDNVIESIELLDE